MIQPDETPDAILRTLRDEIARQRVEAEAEPDPTVREQRLRQAGIRSEVADEEAAAISAEIAESNRRIL